VAQLTPGSRKPPRNGEPGASHRSFDPDAIVLIYHDRTETTLSAQDPGRNSGGGRQQPVAASHTDQIAQLALPLPCPASTAALL
jgi:hypothetical protein